MMKIELGSGWKFYHAGIVPYGATPIGVIHYGAGDSGALVKTAVGYYQMNDGIIGKPIATRTVEAAIASQAIERLPQIIGKRGGLAGTGTAKVRGGSEYYKAIGSRGGRSAVSGMRTPTRRRRRVSIPR